MDESIERSSPDFDPSDAVNRDLDGILDKLQASDVDEARAFGGVGDAADEIRVPPDPEFLAWHAEQDDAGPQRYERPGDRLPWTEHPENPAFEHYNWRPDLERDVQDAYAEGGVCAESVAAIDPVDDGRNGGANCGECARSTASMLDGCPRAAAELNPLLSGERVTEMETWAGRPFEASRPTDSALDAIDRRLAEQGDGAHGIIFGHRELGTGHFLNVARIDGRTVVIDAQQGGRPLMPLDRGGRAYLHDQQLVAVSWLPLERTPHA
jgi:Papain fold toxin 1, glutamine deamidase